MERYVIRGGSRAYGRLRVLARSWWPTTSALLDRVGPRPGMRCLDVGCGSGDVTLEIARRVAPDGRVVGVDFDGEKLDLAREAAVAQGVSNVEFRVEDVSTWAQRGLSEPDGYDLVYSRLLMQHLSRPVYMLRAMWGVVREGGAIAVEDADFEGCFSDPPHDGYAFWVETYQQVLRLHGADPILGRKLHRYFREADIPAPELAVVQRVDVDGEAKLLPGRTVEATADDIVRDGIASPDEIADALASLAAFAADPTFVCGSPRLFQAWSRRASS